MSPQRRILKAERVFARLDMEMGGLDFSYRLNKIEAPYIKSSS